MHTPQTVAQAIGRKRSTCPAVQTALRALARNPGGAIIGTYYGTARYMGAITRKRLEKKYPGYWDCVQVSRGQCQGNDQFVIIGTAYTTYTN